MRILGALCLMLALATSASAECAWVLWEMAQVQDPKNPELATRLYGIVGANGTEDGCRAMSRTMNATTKDKSSGVIMYYCLPDTVDPRGVKGRAP